MAKQNVAKQNAAKTRFLYKQWGYLLFYLVLMVPVASMQIARIWGFADVFAFSTVAFIFGFIPVIDRIVGHDPCDVDENLSAPGHFANRYYQWLTLAALPVLFMLLLWSAEVFTSENLSVTGQLGWLLSTGLMTGLGINVAHELIHKDTKTEHWAGGLLLSMVCYGSFKVEHIRGHHVNIATPLDASTARFDESLYRFLPKACYSNITNAWRLEKKRLHRLSRSWLSPANELFWWYGFSLLFLILFCGIWGLAGGIFFIGQSIVAVVLLETINYLEHYGLQRKQTVDGRYERVTAQHSWNADFLMSNLILFQLPRHSDHHANAKKPYQLLRNRKEAPQLPAGYPGMVILALFPPVWRKIMNPRVRNHQASFS